jgi:hypothetical protein
MHSDLVGPPRILLSSTNITSWRLENNPATAKFLTPQERLWAVERLRNNNTGVETKEIKWNQVLECVVSPSVWLFIAVTFCVK